MVLSSRTLSSSGASRRGRVSGFPLTVSTRMVSPDLTVITGLASASYRPHWIFAGMAFSTFVCAPACGRKPVVSAGRTKQSNRFMAYQTTMAHTDFLLRRPGKRSYGPEKFLQQVLCDSLAILAGGASIVDWGDFGEKCAAAFFDQRRPDLFAREQPFHLTAANRNRGDTSERDSRFDNASVFH